jgi:hypothetical protein
VAGVFRKISVFEEIILALFMASATSTIFSTALENPVPDLSIAKLVNPSLTDFHIQSCLTDPLCGWCEDK